MKIAFDYDETITADPDTFIKVMNTFRDAGHYVCVCTYRDRNFDRTELLDFLEQDDFDIIYTKGVAKRWWCMHFGPGDIDIWVDDKPERIFSNSEMHPDDLKIWRQENLIAESA